MEPLKLKPEQVEKEAKGAYFQHLTQVAAHVVDPVKKWWEKITPKHRVTSLSVAGTILLGAAVGLVPPLQNAELPVPIGLAAPAFEPPQTGSAAKPLTIDELEQRVLAEERHATEVLPEDRVEVRATPLTTQEKQALLKDFVPIQLALKEMVRTDALSQNKALQFDDSAKDANQIDAYQRAGFLEDVSEEYGYEEYKRNPNDRILFFLPQGGTGSIAATVFMSDTGEIYRTELFLMIDKDGNITSQFALPKPSIPQEELQRAALRVYRTPDSPLEWKERKSYADDDGIITTVTTNGKTYTIEISPRGYSGITIEHTNGTGQKVSVLSEKEKGLGIKKRGEAETEILKNKHPDLYDLRNVFKSKFNSGLRGSMDYSLFKFLEDDATIIKEDGKTIYKAKHGSQIEVQTETKDGITSQHFVMRLTSYTNKDIEVILTRDTDGKLIQSRFSFFVYEDAHSLAPTPFDLDYVIIEKEMLRKAIETALLNPPQNGSWEYVAGGTKDRPYEAQGELRKKVPNKARGTDSFQISQDGRIDITFGPD